MLKLKRLDTSDLNSPHQPGKFKFPILGTDEGQITVGCLGGNVEALNWSVNKIMKIKEFITK